MVKGRILFTVEEVQAKVTEIAERINEDYKGREILAVGILKGAFMFFSDLVRRIEVPLEVDFIVASSYLKTETTGEVKVHCDVRADIRDREVLLIEDIIDTGVTMNHLRERFLSRAPRSLRICAFLDKRERRLVDVPVDYVGYEIPNVYVVGYGLDYDDKFRNLPYISEFRRSD